ncbi:VCBS repeat-containing protein [Candidatus Dojkabacteria bacterium]|nr:VCBS repeat-containing protein [Candidatus Dojkabacteria bacterium]
MCFILPEIYNNGGIVYSNNASPQSITSFNSSSKWHGYFAPNDEIPLVGDFDHDGLDDIVTFTSDKYGDVWVAANTGSSFGTSSKWHNWFAPNDETPLVGDFDGDHFKDDIVTFTGDGSSKVWVALGDGEASFQSSASLWHSWFAPNNEIPLIGDFNNDGYDDIVTFVSDGGGDVWVALNNGGTGFGTSSKWHSYFAPNDEIPAIGDFNDDGYDDIVTFTSDGWGDVWVALNDGGTGFGTASKWNDWFAPYDEVPAIGDFDNDGLDDIVTFVSDGGGDVWVALSNGSSSFEGSSKWHDYFAPYDEIPRVGDFDNDMFKDDIVTFVSDVGGDVWLASNPDDPESTEYNFHIASDMQERTGPGIYDTTDYFRGVAEAIAADDSDFFMTAGDMPSMTNTIWSVETYMGAEFPWYPVMGNHELPGHGSEAYYGENMDILRAFDYGTVNPGPATCPETTYSFDHGNMHIIALNVYCDSVSDTHTDGDITTPVYNWLASDLAATDKDLIFVVGHEPAYPQPDQENGTSGHTTDSLNKYVSNRDAFWQLLADYNVVAYFCGHTHKYSAYHYNTIWQMNTAHSQGLGDMGARSTYVKIRTHDDIVFYETYRRNWSTGIYELYDRHRIN